MTSHILSGILVVWPWVPSRREPVCIGMIVNKYKNKNQERILVEDDAMTYLSHAGNVYQEKHASFM